MIRQLTLASLKASSLWKSSAHLDKCATAKTVHYYKNRDKIINNKQRKNYYIAIFPPIQVRRKNGYIFRGGGGWL
jgi:hypothetical protein